MEFDNIAFNCKHKQKQEMLVFNKDYSRKEKNLDFMQSIKVDLDDVSSNIKFVRN